MEPFRDDPLISNLVLELLVLFTQEKAESPLLLGNEKVFAFVFGYLAGEFTDAETVRLAALALCRFAQRLEEDQPVTTALFVKQLKTFDNFQFLLTTPGHELVPEDGLKESIFDYALATLEHVSYI